jgi:hypothetical protein
MQISVYGDLSSCPCLCHCSLVGYIPSVDIIIMLFIIFVMHFIDHCIFIYCYPPDPVRWDLQSTLALVTNSWR